MQAQALPRVPPYTFWSRTITGGYRSRSSMVDDATEEELVVTDAIHREEIQVEWQEYTWHDEVDSPTVPVDLADSLEETDSETGE